MNAITKAIDVSKHNGVIDWPKVKAAGYTAAIIRAGWTWYEGGLDVDSMFVRNMQGAAAAGLNIGVYVYSYDQSTAAARIAARKLVDLLAPYKLSYPVYFDMEYEPFNVKAGKTTNTDIVVAFLEEIEKAGYYAALYCSAGFIREYLDDSRLAKYDKWIAQYNATCTYKGNYGMWQYGVIGTVGTKGQHYTITGSVPGVTGNCDVNQVFVDYPAIMERTGLNGFNKPEATPNYKDLYEAEQKKNADITAKYNALLGQLTDLVKKYS